MASDISLLHPDLQVKAKALISAAAAKGLPIKITQTYRTVAEQDALYAQGRTTAGSIVTANKGSTYSSMHQWGAAFDIARNDGTGAYNTAGSFFEKVGAIGKTLGLMWGGDFSKPDRPHFQLPDWGATPSNLKKKYVTFAQFKASWVATPKITVTYKAHTSNVGWDNNMTDIGSPIGTSGKGLEAIQIQTAGLEITAEVHARNLGDLPVVKGTGLITAGTTGQSAPIEAIKLFCPTKALIYRVHYLGGGWSDYAWNGEEAGTRGKAQAIDKIQIAFGN